MWGCWSGRYLSVDVLGAQIMFETRQNICVHYKTTSIYIIKVNTWKYIQVNSKKRKFQLLLPFPSLHLAFKEIDRVKRRELSHFKIPRVQRVPTRFGQPFLCHPFFQFCLSKIENGIPSKLLTYSTRPPPLTNKNNNSQAPRKNGRKRSWIICMLLLTVCHPFFPPFVFQPPSDIAWTCKSPKPKPLSSKVSRHRLSCREEVCDEKFPPGVKSWQRKGD